MKKSLVLLVLLTAPAYAETIAITGATVWETPQKKVEHATVVITDGKITAVGADVKVPSGATTIDGTDKIVTAGLIEPDTDVGIGGISLEASSVDGQLGDTTTDADEIHASYRVIDGYDSDAMTIPVARTGGVTSVCTVPNGGLVSGQSGFFSLADGLTADDALRAPAAMHVTLGAAAAGSSGNSRGRALEMLRDLLDDAAAYAKNKSAYDKNQSRAMSASRADLAALGPVLKGTEPLVIQAQSEHDIRAALRLAKEKKLKIAILGGVEAWKVADALAKAKVAVIMDPQQNNPDSLEAPDVRDDAAAVLAAAGVQVAFSSLGDGDFARDLRQLAGDAVGDGMKWEDALAAITTVPAAVYGVKDRGTVEKGKAADLVVWSGDPFETSTRAETVIIGGKVQSLDTHQTELLKKYR